MSFPDTRPRRLRRTPALRRLVRETTLSPDNFIFPLFVCPGKGVKTEISSLPGQFHVSVDMLAREVEEVAKLGIPGVILFGLPEKKDEVGSEAWHPEGVVQRAVRAIKKAVPELTVAVDACFCEYTTHGHCGVISHGQLDNDATLENLSRAALSYARAGADVVAPSGMLDGFVGFLREGLDEENFDGVSILSYAAKYASAYYGPFRAAADSTPAFGDRHGYQMDPANVREAIREVSLDVEEGADIVMVKPALAYLDIIGEVRREFDVPIAAYNVSGEYAMLKAAAEKGWIDHDRVMMETLLSIRRAGADMILTYHAKEAAKLLHRA
ncbi:MAG TPA: porphobilinogen synthase [Polyangia bacterium]|jgi:porphobilinogen synthase|nr:porphobilinogen synthase [Polyangia bacterium]